jgi:hypothetical protein
MVKREAQKSTSANILGRREYCAPRRNGEQVQDGIDADFFFVWMAASESAKLEVPADNSIRSQRPCPIQTDKLQMAAPSRIGKLQYSTLAGPVFKKNQAVFVRIKAPATAQRRIIKQANGVSHVNSNSITCSIIQL